MSDKVAVSGASGVDDWDAHWSELADAAERNPAVRWRRRLILRLLEAGGAPSRLVDIGSGQGDVLAAAAERWPTARLLGFELSAQGNAMAATRVPRAELVTADLLAETPADEHRGWATHAVCSEVLEHVDDPAEFVRRARSLLAPGAQLIVTVPGGQMSAFDRHIGHRRHFTPASLRQVIEAAGMEAERVDAAGFPFFNLYRTVVIARGSKLIDDVATGGEPRGAARALMAAFDPLLRASLRRGRLGWQIVGVAREPAARDSR